MTIYQTALNGEGVFIFVSRERKELLPEG